MGGRRQVRVAALARLVDLLLVVQNRKGESMGHLCLHLGGDAAGESIREVVSAPLLLGLLLLQLVIGMSIQRAIRLLFLVMAESF